MKKLLLVIILLGSTLSAELVPVGTKESLGKVDGVEIEVCVQSPSAENSPLQIVCLFEYSERDIYTSPPALPQASNGLVHVDVALHGLLTDLRKSHKFEGKALETLLITPPPNSIKADKLLFIGLGSRKDFTPEMMRLVGLTGMREALRLGVTSYAHASDLKDGGLDSPTAEIAGNVVKGALEAYRTQAYLVQQKASEPLTVTKMTLLSGQPYFEDSKSGIKKVLDS